MTGRGGILMALLIISVKLILMTCLKTRMLVSGEDDLKSSIYTA